MKVVHNFTIGIAESEMFLPLDVVVELPDSTEWEDIERITGFNTHGRTGYIPNGWSEIECSNGMIHIWKWTLPPDLHVDFSLSNHNGSPLLDMHSEDL